MKPGSSKQAARGRQEAPAASQRGTLGGTFDLNGVPPLAIGPGRPPGSPWGQYWWFSYYGPMMSTGIVIEICQFRPPTQPPTLQEMPRGARTH